MSEHVDPSNPKNEFDYVGKVHNSGLENFITHYKEIDGLVTDNHLNFQVLLNANTLYLGDDESLLKFNSAFSNDANFYDYMKFLVDEKPDFINALSIVKFDASDDFKKTYQKVLDTVDEIDFSDERSLEDYINSIKEIEEEISKSKISDTEKQYLFGASSVSRYSAVYWFEIYNTKSTDWDPKHQNTPSTSKQIIKFDIGGALGGAAIGAIVGGTVTIYAFGIGAIPGWAAGLITGAVGGSITEATVELLDWLFG